jgi:hypothetical protein
MTRGSNEIKLSVYDRFYEPTTIIKIRTCLYNEDSVTFKSLSLVPINKPLDQSHKYKQATVGIKPHISGAFVKDNFHYLTVVKSTHGSDSLPPDISTSQLESAIKKEDADDRQGNKVIDDHDQKSDPTIDEDTTHPRISVGENYEPKVNIVKKVVEEYYVVEDPKGAEEHHWSLRYHEIASFMKEYMQLTNNKEPSVVDENYKGTVAGKSAADMMHNTATPEADYPLADTGADEVRHMDGEHPGEHDDQPPVKLLGDMIEMDNAEKVDPHNAGPGPGAVADQTGHRDHAAPGPEPAAEQHNLHSYTDCH